MKLEKPNLYELKENGPELMLIAAECKKCRSLVYPKTPFGCPSCGADGDAMKETLLDGRVTLLSFATMHAKLAPTIAPPCVVGDVEIAPGLLCEVMLQGNADQYEIGMTVNAVGIEVEREGETFLACRFIPNGEV